MTTAIYLITEAAELAGILGSGETMSAADAATCLRSLNNLLDDWNTQRLALFTVQESTPATFSVGVAGTGASFQWYRESNGIVTAVSGANLQNLTIPVVTAGDAGNYFVGASNVLGTVYSGMARLTVTSDTNPPVLVDADGSTNSTRVIVTFSELVSLATATNTANYSITNTGAIGLVLYTRYLYFFQAAGLILLVAMIGAIVLTLRHKNVKRQNVAAQVARSKETAMEVKKVVSGQGLS
jgi:hypothetical protein